MISGISIRSYKSFHPTEATQIAFDVNPAKPVFMYGLNGAGKSAIGEVLQRLETNDPAVDQCSVTTTGQGPFRYLIYNHEFVDRSLGQAAGMPGIFTLGEIDTETQKKIEANVEQEAQLRALRESISADISDNARAIENTTEMAMAGVWKAHGAHVDGPLGELLKGYGNARKKFFTDLRTFQVPDDMDLLSFPEITQRWADISGNVGAKALVSVDFYGLDWIEQDPIWNELIAVSGSSRLAPLIEQLKNSDWVAAGRDYLPNETCPFCQQELPYDFETELRKLLDGDRQLKLDEIVEKEAEYRRLVGKVQQQMDKVWEEPLAAQSIILHSDWEIVWARLQLNLAAMQKKLEKPGDRAAVERSHVGNVQTVIASINQAIGAFNKRVADRAAEKKRLHTAFWRLLCRDRMPFYQAYDAAMEPLKNVLAKLTEDDARALEATTAVLEALTSLRRTQKGVDASVAAINTRLRNMGIETFAIVRKQGEGSLYGLSRPGQKDADIKSLSEGEKTLISFLYYMELLKGSNDEDSQPSMAKTIVVIDDPISSLSVNYIFDIASSIHHELIKPDELGRARVRQVIVLTHNLFFLHELLILTSSNLAAAEKRCQLIRVSKHQHTKVLPMRAKDLMNDYDALWQILREARDGNLPAIALPNTMRCILEQFYSFTQKEDKFGAALLKMEEEKKFVPLSRFLNRGSHKDGVNLSVMDYAQYDVPYYLEKFETVFKEAGFPDHFALRMENATEADL